MSRVVAVVAVGSADSPRPVPSPALAAPVSSYGDHSSHHKGESNLEIVVLESGDRFGGKILSGEFRDVRSTSVADNFYPNRVSQLCDQLAIATISCSGDSSARWCAGALRPLPTG